VCATKLDDRKLCEMWMHMATGMLGAKRVQREFLLGRFLKQMTIYRSNTYE
jgi:hypothetical protein